MLPHFCDRIVHSASLFKNTLIDASIMTATSEVKKFFYRVLRTACRPSLVETGALVEFSAAGLSCRWEVAWEVFLRDFSGGRPFGAALEGNDEPNAFCGVIGVSHWRVKDSTFSKGDGHHHRFVPSRAFSLFGGVGCGKDLHVVRGASKTVVQFVFGVQPLFGQAASDGMSKVSDGDLEFVLRAVGAAASGRVVSYQFPLFVEIDVRAVFFRASAPTAQSDHLVVGFPVRPAVVGGMHNH